MVSKRNRHFLYHHERWDGNGYPKKLKGEEIPLCARIMAIADVFDALYEERIYKKAIRPARKVLDMMKEERGSQFDPLILDEFLDMHEEIINYTGEEG